MRANCAIDYFPVAFSTQNPQLMGMQAANEGFLGGFLRHAAVGAFFAHTRTTDEFNAFAQAAEAVGRDPVVPCHQVVAGDNEALGRVGALLHPFPGFGPLAWVRRFGPEQAYSLLGITHTTATAAVMDSIGNLLTAPIQPWDAVVCTSTAVRRTYQTVLDHWQDYLADRLGATRFPRPMLPVIPLGVTAAAFAETSATGEIRSRWRQQLAIGADDVVVLWVGRFNHAQKVHPTPSYLVLEAVAHRVAARIIYVQAGWFPSPEMEQAFYDAARRFAPTIHHVFLDGRQPEVRNQIWHAADIFLSLSDNIQETFGLTPIEAMAAGLPVVVTDWDGYRDTVRDGVEGLRVPTAMPPGGAGADIAHGFAAGLDYEVYCGITAQTIGFDYQSCVEGLVALVNDPARRRAMGQAGRRRAADIYDWQQVVTGYHDLLDELGRIRAAAAGAAPRKPERPAFPLRADPYETFGAYPTRALAPETLLYPAATAAPEALVAHAEHPLNQFAIPWCGGIERLRDLLARIHAFPGTTARTLGEDGSGAPPSSTLRGLAWLAKMGLIRLFPPSV
jgi:glycosyltransferase involved in cell wall biosynthesis